MGNYAESCIPMVIDQPTRHLQHKLSNLLLSITHEKICNSASTRDKAQLLSNQGNSSIWSINPSSSNLLIPNSLYKINVARTLLISITKCNCKVHYCPFCHKKCDPYGDHSLLCYADGPGYLPELLLFSSAFLPSFHKPGL